MGRCRLIAAGKARPAAISAPRGAGTVPDPGEDVTKYEDGQFVNHDGLWLAGDGASQAGAFMPAAPIVEQRFAQDRRRG